MNIVVGYGGKENKKDLKILKQNYQQFGDAERMEELVEKCLAALESHPISFGEARVFSAFNEQIRLKNEQIEVASTQSEKGYGVRVILDGAWGFACSGNFDGKTIPIVTKTAIKVAKASGKKKSHTVELTDEPTIEANYQTKCMEDPFDVSTEEKLSILKESEGMLRGTGDQIKVSAVELVATRIHLNYGNSEGTRINQIQTYTGANASAIAQGTDVQNRGDGEYQMKGFEFVRELDFPSVAENVGWDAMILVTKAKKCPTMKTSFILEPFQLGLTIHESCGHPTELDRALGTEADFAGTSFLTPDKLDQDYRYGSEIVNLVSDPTIEDQLGHYKYDDEGVKAKRVKIIEDGIFRNYMTDRESAKLIGLEHSNGNSGITNYNRIPLVRMSHLYLEPDVEGPKSIIELIEDTKEGIYGIGWKSHSIDDKRVNFQFACQIGYHIKDGELAQPLKNVTYQAKTPEFWGNCDAITKDHLFRALGPNCGKGVPMQAMWVSHGGTWARFSNTQVGVSSD